MNQFKQLIKNGGIYNYLKAGWEIIQNAESKSLIGGWIKAHGSNADYYEQKVFPIILYSSANIFYNKIPALDVNFINPSVYYSGGKVKYDYTWNENTKEGDINATYEQSDANANDEEKFKDNTAYQIRDTIAGWYKALRNIAIVALLSVLVYVAIRIILSSTAGETAKYKQMLKDWILAFCLLFVMHYMMAFLLNFSTSLTNIVNSQDVIKEETGQDVFMTIARTQAEHAEDSEGNSDLSSRFGYTIIYTVLVIYTLVFTVKYVMRLIYLAFLTMIAPLVAITYPIDKISDGKAQAFQVWFREYVFNVLLQPMHMILYTILITSVSAFAERNMIYACVAIGFLLPAEKLVKTMFGFNKADGGGLEAALTGASIFGATSGLVEKAFSRVSGGESNKTIESSNASENNDEKLHFSRQADLNAPKGLSGFSINSNNTPKNLTTNGTNRILGNNSRLNQRNNNRIGSRSKGRINSGNSSGLSVGNTNLKKTKEVAKGIGKLGIKGINFGGRTIKGAATMTGRFTKKVAKPSLKLAGGAILGGTGAMIGMAAGLATDDYSNVAKFGAAGAGVGAFAGKKAVDAGTGAINVAKKIPEAVDEAKENFIEGYMGKEKYAERAIERQNKKSDKEWKKDKDVIARFQREYGKDYKNKMEKAMELRKAGITEQKDIESALGLIDKNDGLTTEQAANIISFSKGLDKKDLLKKDIRENLRNKAVEMTGSEGQADKVMNLVDQKVKLK